ncbi:hypothetical protein MS3_00000329 [Schistosoma haematobium]|uniref:Uncharacterized protein n=1 Tax=Schistosoma haematobium TaxID=6185 RepID=A0A922ISS9_SCHHA|nr:hypothetical protein MS3_00000329 [Schistosoma haematobium]KAH9586076.1 hypothetical protein MS3_00000329 [Schistosoma haematobium]
MILNLFSVLSTCNEICQHPDWTNFKKVIFVNESYRYSHHYHYSQTISLNQPHTDVNCSFIKLEDFEDMQTPFSLKYFGTQVSKFRIYSNGVLNIFENNEPIGQILNELYDYESRYRLIQKGLIAFKWVADTKFKITRKSTNMKPAHLHIHGL